MKKKEFPPGRVEISREELATRVRAATSWGVKVAPWWRRLLCRLGIHGTRYRCADRDVRTGEVRAFRRACYRCHTRFCVYCNHRVPV